MNIEKSRRRIEFGIKILGLGIAGLVVTPVIFLAVKGLVGLALSAVVGLAIVNFTPVIATWFANWKLKAIKFAAHVNPVETLQNEYGVQQEKLGKSREAIETFSAAIMNFRDKLDGFKKNFPNDSKKFDEQLGKMNKLLKIRQTNYKNAELALTQFEFEIRKADALWKMGQEAAHISKVAGMTEEDWMSKIKTETAIDSVTQSLNTAFAQLETSLLEEDEPEIKLLTNERVTEIPLVQRERVTVNK